MAEFSILWTTGTSGDGTSTYTQTQLNDWLRRTFCGGVNEGILKGFLNALAVSGVATPVSVATGGAYVYGFPYQSDAVVTVAIPTPSVSTRIDRIVLRADWAAHTVRITRIAGVEGAGAPAMTQTPGTTYDIPLAQVSITTGGVITCTDERDFLNPNIEVSTAMLADTAVTSAKIGSSAVTAGKIGSGAVTEAKIGAAAVTAAKLAALAATPVDGWNDRTGETWTRTAATTFTVPTDLTAVFRKGAKIRLKQGGAYKYFYVVSSTFGAVTTVTVTGGSDYSLAAGAITDNYVSYIENPEGFPDWFNWTPTIVGYSADPASPVYRFRINAGTVTLVLREPNMGTSDNTIATYSLPVTAKTIAGMEWAGHIPFAVNNGSSIEHGRWMIASAGTVINTYQDVLMTPWTNSGQKAAFRRGYPVVYEMA